MAERVTVELRKWEKVHYPYFRVSFKYFLKISTVRKNDRREKEEGREGGEGFC